MLSILSKIKKRDWEVTRQYSNRPKTHEALELSPSDLTFKMLHLGHMVIP